jgi:hypothetical protein
MWNRSSATFFRTLLVVSHSFVTPATAYPFAFFVMPAKAGIQSSHR